MSSTKETQTPRPHEQPTSSMEDQWQVITSPSPQTSQELVECTPKSTRRASWRSFSSRHSRDFGAHRGASQTTADVPNSTSKASLAKLLYTKDAENAKTSRRLSRASTSISNISASSVDWGNQKIEGYGSLEPDGAVRPKAPYLVVTPEYIVKLKNRNDALALFPELAQGIEPDKVAPASEPPLIIPVSRVVSAFKAESTRPSFGIEVWWESKTTTGYSRAEFSFNLPKEREDVLTAIHKVLMRQGAQHPDGVIPIAPEVEAHLNRIALTQDSQYAHQKPEIFPVVLRAVPRGAASRGFEELPRKSQDGGAYYLVVSANFLFVVEISSCRVGTTEKPTSNYYKMGLAALEVFEGHWTGQEERFVVRFRVPWSKTFSVELASRYYRQISLTMLKADRLLKPAWPQMWQYLVTFRVDGLRDYELQPPITEAHFECGGLARTLDSYLTAYNCPRVKWDIKFQSELAPEFCLLPAGDGTGYSPLQLVAVFRALRYNAYFRSLSFKDIDLFVLCGLKGSSGLNGIASISRSGRTLEPEHLSSFENASVLHQELHALAFASESIEKIDFTNSLGVRRTGDTVDEPSSSAQLLAPIVELMKAGLTRCSQLVLDGDWLTMFDVEQLSKAVKKPATRLTALSLAKCQLSSTAMQRLTGALYQHSYALQKLDISGNTGSLPAYVLAALVEGMPDLRQLNVCRSLTGIVDGPLLPAEVLCRLNNLEGLNLSGFKMNDATLDALNEYFVAAPRPRMRQLSLNSCGITGSGAAGLLEAIGEAGGHGLCLSLSANPLEQHADDLARAIRKSCGPAALHMDMVEFRDDTNYARLIMALAASDKVSELSLVGTGPTGSCSRDTIDIFKAFFAINKKVRYLDLSGYDGKLDEGKLGPHFGLALDWLRDNTTLTHLRIRNQNLNEHRDKLGRLVRESKTLRFLDCEENDFSLTSLQFLADNLQENHCLLDFSMSEAEKSRIWRRQVSDLRIPDGPEGIPPAIKTAQEAMKEFFDEQVARITKAIERNRREAEESSGCVIDYTLSTSDMGPDWPRLELLDPQAASASCRTVQSSAVPIDRRHRQPYHVVLSEMDGASDPVSPVSEVPTSPSWAGPSTPEEYDVPKLVGKSKEPGLGFYG